MVSNWGRFGGPRDHRQQMIDETSAFLSWALSQDGPMPRIPRRRVDEGGFRELMKMPGARSLAIHWWNRVLETPLFDRW